MRTSCLAACRTCVLGELFLDLLVRMGSAGGLLAGRGGALDDLLGGGGLPAGRGVH